MRDTGSLQTQMLKVQQDHLTKKFSLCMDQKIQQERGDSPTHRYTPCSSMYACSRAIRSPLLPLTSSPRSAHSCFSSANYKTTSKSDVCHQAQSNYTYHTGLPMNVSDSSSSKHFNPEPDQRPFLENLHIFNDTTQ